MSDKEYLTEVEFQKGDIVCHSALWLEQSHTPGMLERYSKRLYFVVWSNNFQTSVQRIGCNGRLVYEGYATEFLQLVKPYKPCLSCRLTPRWTDAERKIAISKVEARWKRQKNT